MSATKKPTREKKGTLPAVVKRAGLPAKERPPAKVVIQGSTLTKLVLKGDLSGLSEQETMEYYLRFCEHLGLDPVTRPFDLLVLNGKKVLYAHKGCTDQLRMKYGVSVTDLRGEILGDCYRVTAIGRDHKGRTDAATGVVKVKGLQGDAYANAVMKAETKAKRRLTLSLCGLGMLDETEVETIPGAMTVDLQTGEAGRVFDIDPAPTTPSQERASEVPQASADDSWRWAVVKDSEGARCKVPQSYWAKKGNRQAQQMALVEAFGPAEEYRVEKDDGDGKWYVYRKLGAAAEEGQGTLDAIGELNL